MAPTQLTGPLERLRSWRRRWDEPAVDPLKETAGAYARRHTAQTITSPAFVVGEFVATPTVGFVVSPTAGAVTAAGLFVIVFARWLIAAPLKQRNDARTQILAARPTAPVLTEAQRRAALKDLLGANLLAGRQHLNVFTGGGAELDLWAERTKSFLADALGVGQAERFSATEVTGPIPINEAPPYGAHYVNNLIRLIDKLGAEPLRPEFDPSEWVIDLSTGPTRMQPHARQISQEASRPAMRELVGRSLRVGEQLNSTHPAEQYLVGWRIHTRALVEAGYGVATSAWVFTTGAKHNQVLGNLRRLLAGDALDVQPGFDPSRFREFDPEEFERVHGRPLERTKKGWDCPYCGYAGAPSHRKCWGCKAQRCGEWVFPESFTYVHPGPIATPTDR